MLSATLSFAVLLGAAMGADPPAEKSPVQIECHGKLRNKRAAIGGETTGARIEFDTIYLDLKAADKANQDFINNDDHNKQAVTVIGTVRQATGPERGMRWVIDVEKISLRLDPQKNGAKVTITGKLVKDEAGRFVMDTTAGKWPLESPDDKVLSEKMAGLLDKMVTLAGKPMKPCEERFTVRPLVRVEGIELFAGKMAKK